MGTRLGATFFVLMGCVVATAQVPSTSAQVFEVASVKRNLSGSTRASIQVPPAGTITFVNVKLRILIRSAYNLDLDQFTLISGPFAKLIDGAPGMRVEDVVRFAPIDVLVVDHVELTTPN